MMEANPANAAVLTSTLIDQVTTSLTRFSLADVESHLKDLILNVLDEPLR